ncbi:heparinase II/III family protein [Candidatus Pelagibacter bacterium nBUS_36]|uniref:heparinase II/III family protein n=1 Tax=Candidatus Pelagibacter bacterium nBUS_36 TaxID=3374194 RepID=UPI003EB90F0B
MVNTNYFSIFSTLYYNIKNSYKKFYWNSNLYNKKISKTFNNQFRYKPSAYLLSSIIKYQKKKYKIEDFAIETIWQNNINLKDYEKLNNFFWFFSLDLKSSKKTTQSIITNWINNNDRYNSKSWDFDITAKRIISWLSTHQLSYEDASQEYRLKFDHIIQKQANHLLNEINNSDEVENKMIGCAAIILTGLCYHDEKNYLSSGLGLLKKIIKSTIDNQGFPKSRSINQLNFYLKYFIIIREWFKESQNLVPEYIDETIYYLGSNYAFVWKNIGHDILFNGNYVSNNNEFDQYLKRFGYKFKNENKELAGYAVLKNKKIILAMDIGSSPIKNQSKDYQSGVLSFEIISNGQKLISNSGYYSDKKSKLNKLSKSSALQSTLTIEDYSSCSFKKNKDEDYIVSKGLKITKKNIILEDNYWKISSAHDGYFQKFGIIHEREIEFYPEQLKFIGLDKILNKNINKNIKFDIRFHLDPNSKVMKTQDNKSIFIELEDQGWKFSCNNYDINIDNGLYFGNKNSYKENQNIFISGMTDKKDHTIKWEITKL